MSTHVQRSIVEKYNCQKEKVVTAFCGTNSQIIHNERPKESIHSKNVLFVGVAWERKGGPQLVEAMKIVQRKHPTAKLTIVGCNPKINGINNCTIVGKVTLDKVSQYYKNASVFCMPTRIEPFGIVFIEAMSHKLPIISSTIGALPDLVKDGKNGYLVDCDDICKLASKISLLLENEELNIDMGQNGYELATRTYTWENTGRIIKENIEKYIL